MTDKREELLPGQPGSGWVDVTVASHPTVHAAFEVISHDMGEGAGHETYSVAPEYVLLLAPAEAGLATLTEDQLQEFSIGDAAEHDKMRASVPNLRVASLLLNGFFDDWDTAL